MSQQPKVSETNKSARYKNLPWVIYSIVLLILILWTILRMGFESQVLGIFIVASTLLFAWLVFSAPSNGSEQKLFNPYLDRLASSLEELNPGESVLIPLQEGVAVAPLDEMGQMLSYMAGKQVHAELVDGNIKITVSGMQFDP